MGGLTAAARLGRTGFERLMVFSSLSKRSNVPGLRSGLVAGDASLIARFLKYRTYHGSAMSPVVQAASLAAWNDEAHVIENRQQYQAKFDAVLPILAPVLDVQRPSASFYLWAATPVDDLTFTRELLVQQAVHVLPGSFLARQTAQGNPGAGRIRIALVAPLADCIEGAHRIASLARKIKEDA
jgi:N-succinyldiaminopimelate aminotransferase